MLNVLAAVAASGLSRPCLMPPQGSSPQCIVCYTDACIIYEDNKSDCLAAFPPGVDRQACLDLAEIVYTQNLAGCPCNPVAYIFPVHSSSAELLCNYPM